MKILDITESQKRDMSKTSLGDDYTHISHLNHEWQSSLLLDVKMDGNFALHGLERGSNRDLMQKTLEGLHGRTAQPAMGTSIVKVGQDDARCAQKYLLKRNFYTILPIRNQC